ncbi:MAG: hypothetical protein ACFHXK_00755 [bacterium]
MNWDAIGAMGEIIGAAAVVATLVYLARQIGQQNRQAKRTENNASFAQFSGLRISLATDPEFAKFLTDSLHSPESLDETGLLRQNAALSELLYISLNYWDREQNGEIDAMPWVKNFGPLVAGILATSGGKLWWNANKAQFPSGYIETIDNTVRTMESSADA